MRHIIINHYPELARRCWIGDAPFNRSTDDIIDLLTQKSMKYRNKSLIDLMYSDISHEREIIKFYKPNIKPIMPIYNRFLEYILNEELSISRHIDSFYYAWTLNDAVKNNNIFFDWLAENNNASGLVVSYNNLSFIEFYNKESAMLFYLHFSDMISKYSQIDNMPSVETA